MFNREKDGDEMVDILLEVLFNALYEKYLIQAEKEWIIELDSTTEGGFLLTILFPHHLVFLPF